MRDPFWEARTSQYVQAIKLYEKIEPAYSALEYLSKAATPGRYQNSGYPEFPFSKSGSGFRIKRNDRYFAITSRHQVREYDPLNFILPSACKEFSVSPDRIILPSRDGRSLSSEDYLIYEYTNAVKSGLIDASRFYDVSEQSSAAKIRAPNLLLGLGFADNINRVEYGRTTYFPQTNFLFGFPVLPKINELLSFRLENPSPFEPRGMSGGPVFALFEKERFHDILPIGIITNASKVIINYFPLPFILENIERHKWWLPNRGPTDPLIVKNIGKF
ncbi:hypothetical protein [Jannaschia donghaensis]|uniref:hypothetical protein n=1 Tax=Jannaschia donghaensis TaxID=420998 RepID=UPI000A49E269|nr:hypothetical protein [Jannaschia donghaensis]